jgi:hypothetical protein
MGEVKDNVKNILDLYAQKELNINESMRFLTDIFTDALKEGKL